MGPDRFRAKAYLFYENGITRIMCEEPSCEFHQVGGCLNPEVIINDDCPIDQYCESYIPQDSQASTDIALK